MEEQVGEGGDRFRFGRVGLEMSEGQVKIIK